MIKNAYAEENFTEILSCQVHDGFEWRDKREKFLAMKPTQTDKKNMSFRLVASLRKIGLLLL